MQTIEERVQKIEERNRAVEMDKAWEKSLARRIILMIFSYLAIAIFFIIIKVESPWINAIVPTVGFLLSTLSLSYFKKIGGIRANVLGPTVFTESPAGCLEICRKPDIVPS